MTDALLADDIVKAAMLTGEFRLRSGQVASHYFDKYRFESDPALLRRIADAMLDILPEGADLLAGLELGGIPICTAMSLKSGIPALFVRKESKEYGTCLAVEGGSAQGKRVVLIEDVITTGGAVADAAGLVEDAGAQIVAVVCAIWRGEGEPRIAKRPDLEVRAALRADRMRLA